MVMDILLLSFLFFKSLAISSSLSFSFLYLDFTMMFTIQWCEWTDIAFFFSGLTNRTSLLPLHLALGFVLSIYSNLFFLSHLSMLLFVEFLNSNSEKIEVLKFSCSYSCFTKTIQLKSVSYLVGYDFKTPSHYSED